MHNNGGACEVYDPCIELLFFKNPWDSPTLSCC
jgi:hypothetical protein